MEDVKNQWRVLGSGRVKCDYRLDEAFWLNNHPISYYFEDLASGLDGKEIEIAVKVINEN